MKKSSNKNVVSDELEYEDYTNVLFNRSYMRYKMKRIQNKNHDRILENRIMKIMKYMIIIDLIKLLCRLAIVKIYT